MSKQVTQVAAVVALTAAINLMKEAKTSGRRINREDIGKAMADRVRIDIPNASDDYVSRTPEQWAAWLTGPQGQFGKLKDGKPTIAPRETMLKVQKLYATVCYRGRSGATTLGESQAAEVASLVENALSSLDLD